MRLHLVAVVPLLVLATAAMPQCSEGLRSIVTPESRRTDDAFPGSYVEVTKEIPEKGQKPNVHRLKVEQREKDGAVDYVVTSTRDNKPKEKDRWRVSIVEVGGKRFLDARMDLEGQPEGIRDLTFPLHFYVLFEATADGYALSHLKRDWLEAQNAKAPIATLQLQSSNDENGDLLSGDVAAIHALLTKAATDPTAWDLFSTYQREKPKKK